MSTISVQRASTPTGLTQSLCDYMDEMYSKVAQRAFSFFETNGRTHGHDVEHWLKAEAEFFNAVPLELSETDTELAVRAEVPGFTEKELEIVAEPGRLFVTGKAEKKSEEKKKKTLFSEISSNEIFRSISLPAEIDPANLLARRATSLANAQSAWNVEVSKPPLVRARLPGCDAFADSCNHP